MGCAQSQSDAQKGKATSGSKQSTEVQNTLHSVGPDDPSATGSPTEGGRRSTKDVIKVLKATDPADPFDEGRGFTFGDGAYDPISNEDKESSHSGSARAGATPQTDDITAASPATTAPAVVVVKRGAVSDEVMEEDDAWVPPVYDKSDADLAAITKALSANPLFAGLDADERRVVVNAMRMEKHSVGTEVLTAGTDGTQCYYVISTGSVDVIKKDTVVATFSTGQGFGELELMYPQPCAATVVVREPLEVGVLDRATYKRVVMKVSIQRRELYASLLNNLEFLTSMTDYQKQTLADALSPMSFEAGAYIIRYGDLTEWMHIIIDGTVNVMGRDGDDKPVLICTFERGKCIGELEFIYGHNAVADCVAATFVKVASLHRKHFEMCLGPIVDVLKKNSESEGYAYYQSFQGFTFCEGENKGDESNAAESAPMPTVTRTRGYAVSAEKTDGVDTSWVAPVHPKTAEERAILLRTVSKNPLFRALEPYDMDVVVGAMEMVKYSKGTAVMQQGDVGGEHWYIIAEGEVEIDKAPKGIVARFGVGQGFGELELLYNTRTAATVRVSSEQLVAFRLDRGSYRNIIMKVSEQRRALYKQLMGGVSFLQNLDEHQQSTLADALSPASFHEGDVLVELGSEVEWMYIIVDGTAEVWGSGEQPGGRLHPVCVLGTGEMVGELEFVNRHKAVARVVAKTDMRTCKLHRDHFEMCLGPLTDFISKTTASEKYAYYRTVTHSGK